MKKRINILVIFCIALIPKISIAQQYICEYAGSGQRNKLVLSAPPKVALERINDILDVVGLKGNFSILSANIDNAVALVKGSRRYILINPFFMQELQNESKSVWTTYSILAHEIGHHLNGHTIGAHRSAHQGELEADEFSGFILGKMGATLREAQQAMVMISGSESTSTHPARKYRLNAIAKGWNRASDF